MMGERKKGTVPAQGVAPLGDSLPFHTLREEQALHDAFGSMMGLIPPGGIHGAEV